jgi:hypothetical protein
VVFTKTLLLIVIAGLPSKVDGDNTMVFARGKKGGDPVLTVNGRTLIHRGSGPNEIRPSAFGYDPRSKQVWVTDGFDTHFVDVQTGEMEILSPPKHESLRGVWGSHKIVFHHDFLRFKSKGGRLILDGDGNQILLADQSAAHSNRQDMTWFVRTSNALVIMDNFTRTIGYLPLRNGNIETTYNERLQADTPVDLKWFPMPAIVRETPYYKRRSDVHLNRFLYEGEEIHEGLFVLRDSQDQAYLYDLSNPTSFYLGTFDLEYMIVGKKNGQLIVRDIDNERLLEVDPLALVQN